jgi:UDP-2,3-diacylglucosamine pyrophosphatase LpxH
VLIFIGDVHGEFMKLADKLAKADFRDSFLIQVGDFGVGFKTRESEAKQLSSLNDLLISSGNKLFVIRGNHDDPFYFTDDTSYSNITFLKDYSLINIEGKAILLAGGAISIDRSARVLNNSYWKEEEFSYEVDLLEKAIKDCDKIDIVVTHNAPTEFHPTKISQIVIDWTDKDPNLVSDLEEERHRHSDLLNALIERNRKPHFWYYGHFHISHQSSLNGINYRILNSSEFFEHR